MILENITGTSVPGTILAAGAVISIFSVTLVTLYGQTRILFAMGRDGMLPDKFASVNPRTLTPQFNTVVVAIVVALIAGFVPSDYLWDTVSIGTLVRFMVVAIGVIVLRRTHPELPRPFQVPGYPVTPILTVAVCIYILSGLAADHLGDLRDLAADRAGVLLPVGSPARAAQRPAARDRTQARRGRVSMTIVVGHSPVRNDRSPIELAATLARSIGTDLLVVRWCPPRWPTPVSGATDKEYAAWSRGAGRAGGRRGHGAAGRLLGRRRRRGRSRPRPFGRGRAGGPGGGDRRGADRRRLGRAREPGPGRARLDRGPAAARLARPGRDRAPGYRSPAGRPLTRATCAFRADDAPARR